MTDESVKEAIKLASRSISTTIAEIELAVPDMHCAGCIGSVEKALQNTPGVVYARVNLTTRRVRIRWEDSQHSPDFFSIVEKAGFKARLPDTGSLDQANDGLKEHIRALAVAGFAAGNVMMLSLSVWSGADEQTRHLFHLISAAIALPALVFSSRLFFKSAWRAVRVGRTNMDVPICVGIVLTTALSLYDTSRGGGEQVYFDAAIMLVFLLLIGRTLETRMRAKARNAVDDLTRLQPALAHVVTADYPDGVTTPVQKVVRGDTLLISNSDRIPVDCTIESGTSTVDMSLISGESAPVRVSIGDRLFSGCLNLDGNLRAVAVDDVEESFLAKIKRQIDDAQAQKSHYEQLADRVVSYYTPFVHLAALAGFLIWILHSGDWHRAVTVGVAVLIITCPCALGLAVPVARVIAAHQLIKRGILMKDGTALERLAIVDTVVFDKTGTLTTGQTQLRVDTSQFDEQSQRIAQNLCQGAEHPYGKAIARYGSAQVTQSSSYTWQHWCEVPGEGITARWGADVYRLGRAAWALETADAHPDRIHSSRSILTKNGDYLAEFAFEDTIRSDALACIGHLREQGLCLEILSGDAMGPVRDIAQSLRITEYRANARPEDKLDQVQAYQAADARVLMIGDGINDSPALAAASVSMVPATGADMTRKMADFVFLHDQLTAIPEAIAMARRARRIVVQNLTLAVGYNVVALPLAMTGMVTPLVAAVAMSVSSVLVMGNSLRLATHKKPRMVLPQWRSASTAAMS